MRIEKYKHNNERSLLFFPASIISWVTTLLCLKQCGRWGPPPFLHKCVNVSIPEEALRKMPGKDAEKDLTLHDQQGDDSELLHVSGVPLLFGIQTLCKGYHLVLVLSLLDISCQVHALVSNLVVGQGEGCMSVLHSLSSCSVKFSE